MHYLDKIIETINHCSDRIKCETFNYTFNHLPTSYFPCSNAHEASMRSEFEDLFILYLDCKSNTHRNGFKNKDNINFNLQLCWHLYWAPLLFSVLLALTWWCQCMSSPSPLHRYYINQSRTKGEISGGSESNYCIKTRGCNYILEEDVVLFMKYGQTCAHQLYLLHCLFHKEARRSC